MPRRELERLLTDWREAERRRDDAAPGTAEHAAATSEAERLRQAYQREVELIDAGPPSTADEPSGSDGGELAQLASDARPDHA